MPNIKNSQDLEQLLQNNLLDIEQQNKAEIINLEYDKNSKTIRLDIKIDSLEKIVPVEGIAKAIRDNKQIIYIDGYSDNYNLIHASIIESYEKDSIIDAATGTIVGIDYRWMNREVRETAHIRMVGNFRADGDRQDRHGAYPITPPKSSVSLRTDRNQYYQIYIVIIIIVLNS